jgi:putative ABC transport system permease protein
MFALLKIFSWQELRHHPWRNAAALLAVLLGVALAFAVHLINASALSEFSNAARAVGGQSDLELRAMQGSFDEAWYERVARQPEVAWASPVLEASTYVLNDQAERVALRLIGIDPLLVALVTPALLPQPAAGVDRLALLAPGQVFLNNTARQRLHGDHLQIQSALQLRTVSVAGSVSASGSALAVMDIGAAQELMGRQGQITRIDLRLRAGVDRSAWARRLQSEPGWPPQLVLTEPGDALAQINNLSRAYRVNLSVLALMALFTGAFLVFSVLSLSVAKRTQQFALLGVLGLSARERLALVLWESLALGGVGSLAGLVTGALLAALALRVLGGDLGGGYFSGVAPELQWDGLAALLYGLLGVAAALAGAWWPARQAQRLAPALALKGLDIGVDRPGKHWLSLGLLASSALLALAPAIYGMALAAYLSIALLLLGGITALPWLIGGLLDQLAPRLWHRPLPLLAVERARRVRASAAVAVSGVVAALSLAVALTVMVTSFRDSMTQWLDQVLPADMYLRSARHSGAGNSAYFSPEFVQAASQTVGVQRVQAQRLLPLQLAPDRAPVVLMARDLGEPQRSLPLLSEPLPTPPGQVAIYVSEAVVDLHGARPGGAFAVLAPALQGLTRSGASVPLSFFVAGVWRDYAHQGGAIAIDRQVFEELSGDRRANDLALWLSDPAQPQPVQEALRALADAQQPGAGQLLEFGTTSQIRATSLKIFDRSFAVTYWLQAVAIGIGLFGVAASFSAQVLARRKEFGLLAHLGLTRRQILTVVAAEGAAWTTLGAIAGLGLGLAVSVVLVHVVNPQSFHWTMDLAPPWIHLLALCLSVMLAGTVTAWLAGHAAASQDAVLAVKEDW